MRVKVGRVVDGLALPSSQRPAIGWIWPGVEPGSNAIFASNRFGSVDFIALEPLIAIILAPVDGANRAPSTIAIRTAGVGVTGMPPLNSNGVHLTPLTPIFRLPDGVAGDACVGQPAPDEPRNYLFGSTFSAVWAPRPLSIAGVDESSMSAELLRDFSPERAASLSRVYSVENNQGPTFELRAEVAGRVWPVVSAAFPTIDVEGLHQRLREAAATAPYLAAQGRCSATWPWDRPAPKAVRNR